MPNRLDRNASSNDRTRRNWQRLATGAASTLIKFTAPLVQTANGVILAIGNGLTVVSSTLTLKLAPLSGLFLNSTGLGALVDGSTIQINSTGQLTSSTSGGGGSTAIIAADGTIVVGSSTGSTTLKVGTLTSTNLPNDIAYIDKANIFTQAQTVVVSSDPGSPADGELWYNSTAAAGRYQESGLTLGRVGVVYQFATASGVGTVCNSSTYTSTLATGQFPANFFTVGRTLRIRWHAFYSGGAVGSINASLFWIPTSGSSTSVDSNAAIISASGGLIHADYQMTCMVAGTGGYCQASGLIVSNNRSPVTTTIIDNIPNIDTTKAFTLQVMAKNTVPSGFSLQGDQLSVEILDVP